MGVKMVVSITSSRLMPSTPTLYAIPNLGIHAACSTNCMPANPGLKPTYITAERANVARDTANANTRTPPPPFRALPRASKSNRPPSMGKNNIEVIIPGTRPSRSSKNRKNHQRAVIYSKITSAPTSIETA